MSQYGDVLVIGPSARAKKAEWEIGLERVLKGQPVVKTAVDVPDALNQNVRHNLNLLVLLLDENNQDEVAAICRLKELYSGVPLVCVTDWELRDIVWDHEPDKVLNASFDFSELGKYFRFREQEQ